MQSGGVGTCHLPFPAPRSWKWLGGRGGGARLEKPHGPAPSGGNARQGGCARGEVCGMAPRLARGSKRRAWTLIPQRRQYQLNHLRHRAEKRGLSGGDGRRGACEWPCEATVQAWRVSSACGAHLVAEESNWLKVPPAGGAIRTSPGSGCGAVEETRPRDAVMIPRTISTERDVVLTSTFASSACGRSWGKRRARRGLRDWSAGAAGRRSVALACEAWRGTLERRNAAQLRPVQGLTTEHLGAVRRFWRFLRLFGGVLAT